MTSSCCSDKFKMADLRLKLAGLGRQKLKISVISLLLASGFKMDFKKVSYQRVSAI